MRARILKVVAAIPEGRVTTYGAIAKRLAVSPRQVAHALSSLTSEESEALPWFRVVAAGGVLSTVRLGAVGRRQIERLLSEGLNISPRNTVDEFASQFWPPR